MWKCKLIRHRFVTIIATLFLGGKYNREQENSFEGQKQPIKRQKPPVWVEWYLYICTMVALVCSLMMSWSDFLVVQTIGCEASLDCFPFEDETCSSFQNDPLTNCSTFLSNKGITVVCYQYGLDFSVAIARLGGILSAIRFYTHLSTEILHWIFDKPDSDVKAWRRCFSCFRSLKTIIILVIATSIINPLLIVGILLIINYKCVPLFNQIQLIAVQRQVQLTLYWILLLCVSVFIPFGLMFVIIEQHPPAKRKSEVTHIDDHSVSPTLGGHLASQQTDVPYVLNGGHSDQLASQMSEQYLTKITSGEQGDVTTLVGRSVLHQINQDSTVTTPVFMVEHDGVSTGGRQSVSTQTEMVDLLHGQQNHPSMLTSQQTEQDSIETIGGELSIDMVILNQGKQKSSQLSTVQTEATPIFTAEQVELTTLGGQSSSQQLKRDSTETTPVSTIEQDETAPVIKIEQDDDVSTTGYQSVPQQIVLDSVRTATPLKGENDVSIEVVDLNQGRQNSDHSASQMTEQYLTVATPAFTVEQDDIFTTGLQSATPQIEMVSLLHDTERKEWPSQLTEAEAEHDELSVEVVALNQGKQSGRRSLQMTEQYLAEATPVSTASHVEVSTKDDQSASHQTEVVILPPNSQRSGQSDSRQTEQDPMDAMPHFVVDIETKSAEQK